MMTDYILSKDDNKDKTRNEKKEESNLAQQPSGDAIDELQKNIGNRALMQYVAKGYRQNDKAQVDKQSGWWTYIIFKWLQDEEVLGSCQIGMETFKDINNYIHDYAGGSRALVHQQLGSTTYVPSPFQDSVMGYAGAGRPLVIMGSGIRQNKDKETITEKNKEFKDEYEGTAITVGNNAGLKELELFRDVHNKGTTFQIIGINDMIAFAKDEYENPVLPWKSGDEPSGTLYISTHGNEKHEYTIYNPKTGEREYIKGTHFAKYIFKALDNMGLKRCFKSIITLACYGGMLGKEVVNRAEKLRDTGVEKVIMGPKDMFVWYNLFDKNNAGKYLTFRPKSKYKITYPGCGWESGNEESQKNYEVKYSIEDILNDAPIPKYMVWREVGFNKLNDAKNTQLIAITVHVMQPNKT